jgi:hypothetical protein
MLLAIGTFFLAFALPQAAPPQPCPADIHQNVWDPKFAPGQHWSYHNRSIDKGSTLTVLKIDDVPGTGVVVHIYVDRIDFYDKPGSQGGLNFVDRNMSIRRDSLDASVDHLLGIVDIPDLPRNYYPTWLKNCTTLTPAETVADALKAIHERYEAEREAKNHRQ